MPVAMAKGVRRNEVASEEVRIYLGRLARTTEYEYYSRVTTWN